jgi:heat shock protein HslJ
LSEILYGAERFFTEVVVMMLLDGTVHRKAVRMMIMSLAVFVVCVGTVQGETAPLTRKNVAAQTTHASPPGLDELKNATFAGIDTSPIKLVNGIFVGPPYVPGGAGRQRIELLDAQPVFGDLTGDGAGETVVFLSEDNGGTGTYLYMAVMGRSQGKIVTIATVRLGDRLGVRSILIDKGQISLELLQHGAKDAACCPSELVTRTWSLERTGLVERVVKKRPGTLTLATLAGVEWVFRGFKPQQAASGAAETTLVFEKNRISGSAGCNRYLGYSATTKIPGEVTLKASKASNSECDSTVMNHEERYLEALRRVVRFGYFFGDLTLSWQKEDGSQGVMRFAPRKVTAL